MRRVLLVGLATIGMAALGHVVPAAAAAGGVPYGEAIDVATGRAPTGVAVGDLDGDGHIDVVTANNGATVSVLLGTGHGSFAPNVDYGTGANPQSVVVADLDGDGDEDVAVANLGSNTV